MNLKVTEKEKNKDDKQWYKDIYNSVTVAPYNTDRDKMEKIYGLTNGDLSYFKDQITEFCDPMGNLDIKSLQTTIQAFPVLHNKINVLKGEFIKRREKFKTLVTSFSVHEAKNRQLRDAVKRSVDEQIAMIAEGLTPEQIEAQRQTITPKDILSRSYKTEIEIFISRVLRYGQQHQRVQELSMDTLEDVFKADRCFVYCGWKFGRPFIQVRNPLNVVFHKDPNEARIEKSDWILYRRPVTLSTVLSEYSLTDEEIATLNDIALDKKHDVFSDNLAEPVRKFTPDLDGKSVFGDKNTGLNQTDAKYNQTIVWESHLEFKAFKPLKFLSYIDEYNKRITSFISDEFPVPKNAERVKYTNESFQEVYKYVWTDDISKTEFSVETIWVPRKYEIICLNNDIFPVMREVPLQTTSIENPFENFSLSTKGRIFTARNAQSVSLVERAIPVYLQYLFVKSIQNNELAKYQGAIQSIDVDQIPDELGQDVYGDQIRDKLVTYLTYLKKTNKDFYSGSQTAGGNLPPTTRSPGSSGYMLGTAVELMNLQNLLNYLSQEIGVAMGVAPQREAQFSATSNVSDNQQAIIQSATITEPYFFFHSQVWAEVMNEYIKLFAAYCRNIFENFPEKTELFFEYFLEDDTKEVLTVTPANLDFVDMGIFASNSTGQTDYYNRMQGFLGTIAQNASVEQISSLIKDMSLGASPEEIHKRLQLLTIEQDERQQRIAAQQQEAEMKAIAEQDRLETERIKLKASLDRETRVMTATIEAMSYDPIKDRNANNVPDVLEFANLEMKQKKMEHDMEMDKERLKTEKEKIALSNGNK